MRRILVSLIFLIMVIFPLGVKAKENNVTIYFFRGETCSHCEEALTYINKHKDELPEWVEIVTYEVWNNSYNEKLHQALVEKLDVDEKYQNSVPLIVIGEDYKIGMTASKTELNTLIEMANEAKESTDIVKEVILEENIDVSAKKLSDLFSEPNKVVTIVVYAIFGAIVLGFAIMILFSRK